MEDQTTISGNQLYWIVGVLVAIFTLVQGGGAYLDQKEAEGYEKGRASLQQELNTQVNKAQDAQMEAVKASMDAQHAELKFLLEQEINTVQKNLDIQVTLLKELISKQEAYLNEEDAGVKGDLLRETEFLQMQINNWHK